MVVRRPLLTPTDLERMIACGEFDPDVSFELVNGEILYLSPPSHYHAQICALIIAALAPFARRIGARLLTEGAGFMVGAQHRQVRSPDVSLVIRERLSILPPDRVLGTEAPDLAVEVLSPEQHGEAYARPKVAEYLAAGAKVVWLVDPDAQTVRVDEPNRDDYAIYSADADLNPEQIAPGFSAPVRSFFP